MTVPPPDGRSARGVGDWDGKRVLVLSPTPTSPENYGNRRRIRRVCSDIRRAGGHITFVHYASELEWRDILPADAQAEMRAMWDDYHMIAPTVWLHCDPAGSHHEIDEWWDPAIESLLTWLFTRSHFDVFIVNYTWLSRALTLAPTGVLRVLDTHDRFAGRKELLEGQGIAPEFFYLRDDAAEKVALDRADIVWAIKEQEAAQFARFAAKPVITLPYMQEPVALPAPDPDPEGALRVGVIGAGNNINKVNIERFAAIFHDLARRHFAPVRLVIAGSVCDALDLAEDRLVTLMGRVERVEDFYAAVDVVAIPMEFSSGLKVKTGEALAHGRPVVSTAHGFEGYASDERLHRLPDLAAVARAAIALSFAPERLAGLALASRAAVAHTLDQVAAGLAETAATAAGGFSALFVIDGDMLAEGGALTEAVTGLIEFLSHLGAIGVYVARGRLVPGRALDWLLARSRGVVLDPALAQNHAHLSGRAWLSVAPLAEVLERGRPALGVLDTVPDAAQAAAIAATARAGPDTVWAVRAATMALGPEGAAAAEALRRIAPELVLAPRGSVAARAAAAAAGAQLVVTPGFGRRLPGTRIAGPDPDYVRPDVLLVARRDCARAACLARALNDLGHRVAIAETAVGAAGDGPDRAAADGRGGAAQVPQEWIMQQLAAGAPAPPVAVDLTAAALDAMALLERLDRSDVPVLVPHGLPVTEAMPHVRLGQSGPGLWRLLTDIETILDRYPGRFGIPGRHRQRRAQEEATEAGWAAVWQYCARLRRRGDRTFLDLGL